jgi:acetyl-CoA carboxylase biotin carboxyl carrier protein
MSLDILAQLIKILREAPEVGAIEVRRGLFGGWSSIRVTKAGHENSRAVHVTSGPAAVVSASAPAVHPAAPAAGAPAAPAPASNLVEIKSPMVGTFYRSPEPGAEAYVKVGSRVSPGQVVCIIEAMKIMNEIESEVAGVVKETLLENSQPVEFGQPLFRVDPNA